MDDKNYCKINDFKRIFNLKYDFIHDLFNRHSKVFLPFYLGRGEKQSMLFELSENLYNEFLNVYHKVIKAHRCQYKKPITMTYEDFKAKVLDIRYNAYHDIIWTKDLQMCKDRGCVCNGCFYEKFFEMLRKKSTSHPIKSERGKICIQKKSFAPINIA